MPVVAGPPPPMTAKAKTATAKQSKTAQARADAVGGIWQMAGFGAMLTGNLADAGAISKHADPITNEIVRLAESDEKIANVIDKLANIGPYGALIAAVTPMVVQILVNHGRMEAGPGMTSMGVVPKASLEAEMHIAMAEAEMRSQLMRQEAEEQLARVKAAVDAGKANPNGQAPE